MRFPRVGPRAYLLAGVSLFAVKFAIDRLIAGRGFGRDWSPLNYLIPNQTYALASLPPDERSFYLVMLAVAVPFATVGLVLTVGRLRDARLPLPWAMLFFVPVVNLLLFALLGVLPTARGRRAVDAARIDAAIAECDASIPEAAVATEDAPPAETIDDAIAYRSPATVVADPSPSPGASSALRFVGCAVLAGLIAPILVMLGVLWLRNYGWGLFVGAPFVVGFVAATLHGLSTPRTLGASVQVAMAAGAAGLAMTLVFALEGIVCLVMLVPLALPLTIAGGCVGHSVARARRDAAYRSMFALLALLPLLMGAEALAREPARTFCATTSVTVDAPPATVWRHVVRFGEIAPPTDWLARTGLAYPIRARIDGAGVGAVRYCEFSTGPFVEPITVWDEPRLLKFDVTHNPPPLREWGPFGVHPPHLENFLKSHGGEFRLVDLGDGRTRVHGTTWYQHTMWPEAYWGWWSDYVIGRIHQRVLNHVKRESEAAAVTGRR